LIGVVCGYNTTIFVAEEALQEDWWLDMMAPAEAKETFGVWEATDERAED